MEQKCPPAPTNKKEYISTIGKILIEEFGKKKYYTPEEVKEAIKKTEYNNTNEIDWLCWAMCIFTSPSAFNAYHEMIGEICDYVEMKTEMLSGLSSSPVTDWLTIPNLDLETSWLDFGDVFDGIFEGIGEFIGGIFDGL